MNQPTNHKRGRSQTGLPVLDCGGCGVCCLHMGYPAFMQPAAPRTLAEIQSDPELAALAKDPAVAQLLRSGHPGEIHWHQLPDELKSELLQFIANYRCNPGELDGPCFWFDPETRLCKHHLYRPRVCRDFQVNSAACRQWRRQYRDLIMPSTVPGGSDCDDIRDRLSHREPIA